MLKQVSFVVEGKYKYSMQNDLVLQTFSLLKNLDQIKMDHGYVLGYPLDFGKQQNIRI